MASTVVTVRATASTGMTETRKITIHQPPEPKSARPIQTQTISARLTGIVA